ncbi:Y-family DNA polymerase [Pseudomonas aeruginosa]|uniref:Y-family DNA polymerase n=1 Tax=Pseudomonas aeruginosa TaxID=287 RepID=UPI0013CE2339|nr:Y-family DNA polymerase [Pseudomonas aeruginosa]
MESAPAEKRSSEIVGLVDGHCYYVSCHRLFEPRLEGRPVVVLSNNDSAVVSRSDEAKALGVKMSQPRSELEPLIRHQGLILRSSNYTLYQDIHQRFMRAISTMVAGLDPYSVDEAFILLTGMNCDLAELGANIQRHVLKAVGIPVGVGISRNRTTAKLANWASKKWKRQTGSVVALTEYERLRKLLAIAEVSDVWGIGSRLTEHLNSYGIHAAIELADADPARMHRLHGVGLARTIKELNWEYCIGPDNDGSPRKSMTCSRTFPIPTSAYSELSSSLASFAANIGRKLRREGILAAAIRVFLQPARASRMTSQVKSETIELLSATNDTRVLIEVALICLRNSYKEGVAWIRAGLMVVEAIPEKHYTPDMFAPQLRPRSQELMKTMDLINRSSGEGTIRFGAERRNLGQMIRRQYLSNRFTTSWTELPEAT